MKNFYKFIVGFIIILVCIGIGILWKINSFTVKITERKYSNLDDILYYCDDLLDFKARKNDKNNILDDFKLISKYVSDTYNNTSVYISNFNYDDLDNNMYFNGYQMIDNVIVSSTFFVITIRDDKVVDFNFSNSTDFYGDEISLDDLIKVRKINSKAVNLIKNNKKKIGNVSSIDCEYYLIYLDDKLVYRYSFNNGSYIDFDAISGKVIEEYYFNGEYY